MRSYYKNMHVSLISYQAIRSITVFSTGCWQSFWQMWAHLLLSNLFLFFNASYTTGYLLYVVLPVLYASTLPFLWCIKMWHFLNENFCQKLALIWGAKFGLIIFILPKTSSFPCAHHQFISSKIKTFSSEIYLLFPDSIHYIVFVLYERTLHF